MKFISNTLDIAKFLDRKIKFNEVIKSISTDAPTAKPVTPIHVLKGSLSLGKYEAYTLFILSKSAKLTK